MNDLMFVLKMAFFFVKESNAQIRRARIVANLNIYFNSEIIE